jgi:hypothetical protein
LNERGDAPDFSSRLPPAIWFEIMSDESELPELDDRFPTGEWVGFFIQPDSRRRYAMELFLEFAGGTIDGGGKDLIAEFEISGDYETDSGSCTWKKQYLGMHRVIYTGQAGSGGIIGSWQIPGNPPWWTGPYFVWPRAAGDLSERFEQALLDVEFSGPAGVLEPEAVVA